MKSLITFCLSLFVCIGGTHAQTTLYSQNFNSGSASDWTLNTTDLGGDASLSVNQWIINNSYTGGGLFTTTPDQISPIVGFPESYYLHITSALNISSGDPNDCYQSGAAASYIAVMNTPFATTGHTNDTLSFWWLCKGNASNVGKVYYRTSVTDPWQQITSGFCTNPISIYNNSGTAWTQQKVHIDSFDNAPFLEFAFQFNRAAGGSDPSFGVDDIMVYTSTAVVAPVASYTTTATTACQDSCITFTSTSTGTIDSIRWSVTPSAGAAITTPTATPTNICFTAAGTYSVTLTAHNSGGSNTATHVISITPTPHPVITAAGHTLSVVSPGSYTSFQWVKNTTTIITGATNSTYTYSVAATYNVVVDSDGCLGVSNTLTLAVPLINNAANNYWLTQSDNNTVNLFASGAISEALNVTIYDATGRKMLTDIWNSGSGKQVSTSFFPPGLYIVRLSNENTSTVLRFVK